jgi:hypothetical protein
VSCVVQRHDWSIWLVFCVVQRHDWSIWLVSCTVQRHDWSIWLVSCTVQRHDWSIWLVSCVVQRHDWSIYIKLKISVKQYKEFKIWSVAIDPSRMKLKRLTRWRGKLKSWVLFSVSRQSYSVIDGLTIEGFRSQGSSGRVVSSSTEDTTHIKHNKHKRRISMPPAEFEPVIPASKRT